MYVLLYWEPSSLKFLVCHICKILRSPDDWPVRIFHPKQNNKFFILYFPLWRRHNTRKASGVLKQYIPQLGKLLHVMLPDTKSFQQWVELRVKEHCGRYKLSMVGKGALWKFDKIQWENILQNLGFWKQVMPCWCTSGLSDNAVTTTLHEMGSL